MENFKIALQLYSIRNEMAADFEGSLRKVKQLGYDGVEFAGLFDYSALEVKKLCTEIGLVPLSAHVPFNTLMENPDEVLNMYKEIGCKFVVIPYLTEEYRPGNLKFQEVIDGAKLLGEKANKLGMHLCYHNHDFEFVKLNGKYALDVLYEEVPANLLHAQLDTCWVKVGGEDPAEYIRKYGQREEIVHLKDFVGSKSQNMYELIGIASEKKKTDGKFALVPVGSGVQDFPAILEAAKDVCIEWLIVEQDQPDEGHTPLQCAQLSIDYLKTICS